MSHTIALIRKKTPMWVYEKNYAMLRQVFPGMLVQQTDVAATAETQHVRITARIVENCRYTQIVELREMLFEDNQYIRAVTLSIRVYHDARLAEVISYQGQSRLRPRYDYPNHKMYLPDEKRQANHFLLEWLMLMQELDFQSTETCACTD